jgi:hypothetical protein
VSSRAKVITGTVAVAVLAAGGAAFAAVKLSATSQTATVPAVTAPFGDGSYGLGGGRLGGRGFGGGLGPGGDGDGPGLGFGRFFGGGVSAAAGYLGLSATQLQLDLASGKTLAQVAKSHGKKLDGMIAAMVAQARKGLDAAVAGGMLTRAQASLIASHLEARMKQIANGVRPRPGFGPGSTA